MYGDAPLTISEYVMREEHPIAEIQAAVFDFLKGRTDCVIFGAQAVNAYVREQRLTEDVDILAQDAEALTTALRDHLASRFYIAVRIRALPKHGAFRLYQLQKEENRHLVDVRGVEELPPSQDVLGLRVLAPEHVVANKIMAYASRRGQLKSWTDRRDIGAMLLRFPELREQDSPVRQLLREHGATEATLRLGEEILAEEIVPEDEEAGY